MKQYKNILSKYLPDNSIDQIVDLFEKNPCYLKIVSNRSTKHGDFRKMPNGTYQITINHGLNSYRFLLTLVHEIAHLIVQKNTAG